MGSWHQLRKRIHLGCFLVFLALPFLNVIRFDIPRQRFYFFGYELWINEFAIVFFTLMFLMFVVVASSVFYGRVYCGYLCPQMIFSEASVSLEDRLRRWMVKRGHSKGAGKAVFYAAMGVASVGLAFIFMAYFVEPRDLLRRLIALDIHTAGGISGAAVTVVTFLDFTVVRQRFCTTVCPYGYLQGMLGDRNTLLVHYRDEARACIECKKCVRVCPMGIDIRKSPFQIECIHCADCIDACDEILGRLGKPGLIHYTWGEHGSVAKGGRQPWDARRVVVLVIVLLYGAGLFTALSMRKPVLARVSPDRSVMYRVGADGRIYNRFRYRLANRGKASVTERFGAPDLAGARLSLAAVSLQPGESANGEFEISAPPVPRGDVVTHFTLVVGDEKIPMTFLAPMEGK
jgi:cytochrome c oxidase accessory protein FixG